MTDYINLILTFVGGGGLAALITLPSLIKKAKAETKAAEMANMAKAGDAWRDLANERQEAYTELRNEYKEECDKYNAKIDELYETINSWRDKYNHSQEELSQEKIWRASNEVKLCQVKGCEDREPQTGW